MTASPEDLARFLARHKELLSRERLEEIERTSLVLSKASQKALEQNGLALGGLGVASMGIGLGGKTLVELERPSAYHSTPMFPPHTFRSGDLARIDENQTSTGITKKSVKAKKADAGSTVSSNAVEGVIYKVSDTRIIVAVDPSRPGSDEIDLPERVRLLKLANSVTYDRMDDALDRLERVVLPPLSTSSTATAVSDADGKTENMNMIKTAPERTRLMEVLLGMAPLSPPQKREKIDFFDPTLNDSQKAAVVFALEAPELACIHGPPGTGKTHTLIELIRQLCASSPPQRVLVCGASNLAVDNILERLLALGATTNSTQKNKTSIPQATRIGHPARVLANAAIHDATLDARAERSDQAALAKDVRVELESTLATLAGKSKGAGAKGKRPRGAERRKMWDDVKALRKEYRQREGGAVRAVLGATQVVVCTCHAAGGRQLFGQAFDVVIIDEATQALEAVCWVPIFKAKKLVLAGDPKQLPPTVLSVNKKDKKDQKGKEEKSVDQTKKEKDDVKIDIQQMGKDEAKFTFASKAAMVLAPIANDDVRSSSESSDEGEEDDSDKADKDPALSKEQKKDAKASRPVRIHGSGMLRPPRTLETTLFERLERMHGSGIKRMLDVQYRMNSKIADFPNKVMYGGRLKSHSSVATRLLRDLPNIAEDGQQEAKATDKEDIDREALETPVVFFDTAGCEFFERVDGGGGEGSRCNENEAEVVRKWIEELVGAKVLPSQIAVITPYQAQVALLSALLRPTYPDIEIGSVDGMQGREKDAVIISLVRSNDKREVGFLKEKRRLNVAMTRAKRSLCVVGDSETVQHGSSFLKRWMAWLEANADVRYAGD